MQLAMVGLGRMGANLARRLMRSGHECVVFDQDAGAADALAREGALPARSLPDVVSRLRPPRAVWVMLPHGGPTESTIGQLAQHLAAGDLVIDGGNSHHHDDVRRSRDLATRGIDYLDIGTSGGVWGLERGYCLMIGGPAACVQRLAPLFDALAPGVAAQPRTPARETSGHDAERGWLHCGPAGAGHFVKMIHNGIEYGMMQAYAEGFALIEGKRDLSLDVAAIAELWRHGSVVRSWLLDLTAGFLANDASLDAIAPHVADSGEGRWTVAESIEQGVPAPVLALALMSRFDSQGKGDYAHKVLAMMRQAFGGHAVRGTEPSR